MKNKSAKKIMDKLMESHGAVTYMLAKEQIKTTINKIKFDREIMGKYNPNLKTKLDKKYKIADLLK